MKWNFEMNRELLRKWGVPMLLVAVGALLTLICADGGPAPQELSLRELVEKGPGANPHVAVSDIFLSSYAYEEKGGVRQQIWVAAVPLNGEHHQKVRSLIDEDGQPKKEIPLPDDIRVLVKKPGNVSDEELSELLERKTIGGTIVNKTTPLGKDEKKLLAQSYPGIDLDRCWILEVEEQSGALSFFRILGILLLGGGVAWAAWPALKDLAGRKWKKSSPDDIPVTAGEKSGSI